MIGGRLRPGERPAIAESGRLGRVFPALLSLTTAAGVLEGIASFALAQPPLATAAVATGLFAVAVALAGHEIRAGRPVRARVGLAISLTLLGVIGGFAIPGVGHATALLPILSAILVVRYVPRGRVMPVLAAAVGSALGIMVLDEISGAAAAIDGLAGTIFQDGILVGVIVLVLAGLADFALDARDSLANLEAAAHMQLRLTTARLSIVAALRVLHTLPTPEETAGTIASALAELPLVDIAFILKVTDGGLLVLGAAGNEPLPIAIDDVLPEARSTYLLERSRQGAWAELWADRKMPTIVDEVLTDRGIKGQAFAPILAGDDIVGLVGIATTDADDATYLLADLPYVSEAAAVAAAILAPALVARRQLRSAGVRTQEIIASGAFHPVFQPIVDLQTGLTVGFEALTRFSNGVAPDKVFDDAATVGLGVELETATLAAAVRDAARLPPDAWLSVNVSPSLITDPARLIAILAHRTRPITLEITEHEAIDDYGPIHAAMRALGSDVRLAVDDAGAGVANFRHLVELRPALIKIDAGLIRACNADVSRQALVVGLVHFALVWGAVVRADGIETDAEQETVERLGVTLGQGYRLARPAPIEEWARITPLAGPADLPGKVIPIRRRAEVAVARRAGER